MTTGEVDDRQCWRLYRSIGCLFALVTVADPSGGLIDLPISFLLKNHLHLSVSELASFRLAASVPLCMSISFGLLRDTWGAAGVSDRALSLAFSLLGAGLYLLCAFVPPTRFSLLAATFLGASLYQLVVSAQSGLAASLARRNQMTGQMSTVWNIVVSIAASGAFYIGGRLSQALEGEGLEDATRALFLVYAAASAMIAAYVALDPGSLFRTDDRVREARTNFFSNVALLARHRETYPALAIWLIWNFAPGAATPLQYYLQNSLRATDAQWGEWNAIFNLAFVPMFFAYGFLSKRISFSKLVYGATLLALPQYAPLLLVQTIDQAMVAAVLIGFLGGLATAAYLDLLFRSCPPGLEGATMMGAGSLYYVATRSGDVVGAYVYDTPGGLVACVAFTTLLYATIILVLPFAQRSTEQS
jgi:MFS family permease